MTNGDPEGIARPVLAVLAAVAMFTSACAQPSAPAPSQTSSQTPSQTQRAEISATAIPSATPASNPSAYPALPRGTALVPTLLPLAQFSSLPIALTVPVAPGQPAESVVWGTVPFRPDAGYAARIAASFAVTGDGTIGAAPGGSAPWRLWLGSKILAINERWGDVLFFDPAADDGPSTPGPAQRDPADIFNRRAYSSW